jgi:II/X family phage/plasmid replication protein
MSSLNARISRIDITTSLHCPEGIQPAAVIARLAETSTMRYRGRGLLSGSTLYFGKTSQRSTLKMYDKGQEIQAHKGKNALFKERPDLFDSIAGYARQSLRIELTLRGKELVERHLDLAHLLTPDTLHNLLGEYMDTLEHSETVITDRSQIEHTKGFDTLKPSQKTALIAWSEGRYPAEFMPRMSFYRTRKAIIEATGIDIATTPPKDLSHKLPEGVLPFVRFIDLKPQPLPEWAEDLTYLARKSKNPLVQTLLKVM